MITTGVLARLSTYGAEPCPRATDADNAKAMKMVVKNWLIDRRAMIASLLEAMSSGAKIAAGWASLPTTNCAEREGFSSLFIESYATGTFVKVQIIGKYYLD